MRSTVRKSADAVTAKADLLVVCVPDRPRPLDRPGRRRQQGPRGCRRRRDQGRRDHRGVGRGDPLPLRLGPCRAARRRGRHRHRIDRRLEGRGTRGRRSRGTRHDPLGRARAAGRGHRHRGGRVHRGLRHRELPLRPLPDGERGREAADRAPHRVLVDHPHRRRPARRPHRRRRQRGPGPLQHAGQPPHADHPRRAREGPGRRDPRTDVHGARHLEAREAGRGRAARSGPGARPSPPS